MNLFSAAGSEGHPVRASFTVTCHHISLCAEEDNVHGRHELCASLTWWLASSGNMNCLTIIETVKHFETTLLIIFPRFYLFILLSCLLKWPKSVPVGTLILYFLADRFVTNGYHPLHPLLLSWAVKSCLNHSLFNTNILKTMAVSVRFLEIWCF